MIRWPPGLDAERFLAEYWQRQPLYMPAALAPWQCPLEPEDLAGLACEAEVESRFITGDAASGWTLRDGPFEESTFTTAAERDWTVLVQDVEKHLPELARLFEPFAFLPRWRIDDLMVSFAAPGGSVGAHVDDYDVFLLQGLGKRRWSLDPNPTDTVCRRDAPLRILQHFEPRQRIETRPGDILYLPPGVAHHGIGDEPSMTFSIGFRAPSAAELLAAAGPLLDQRRPALRYSDRDIGLSEQDGVQIGSAAKDRAARLLLQALPLDMRIIDEAFGRVVTGNKPWLLSTRSVEMLDPDELAARLDRGEQLQRAPTARFAWTRSVDEVLVFADGGSWSLGVSGEYLARAVCEAERLGHGLLTAAAVDAERAGALLTALLEQGSLEWAESDSPGRMERQMSDFEVREADWEQDAEAIRRVREAVFVIEQDVPADLEWDGLDDVCRQVVAEDANRDAIGTGRLHPSGKIGRMAVMDRWRGRGVGAAILERLIGLARRDGLEEVFLHGQTRVLDFYARYGFVAEGEEFDEADIPHRMMRLKI